jgi:hypothetical protein
MRPSILLLTSKRIAACILGEAPGATVGLWDVFFVEFFSELPSKMGRARRMAAGFRRCIKKTFVW